MINANRTPPRQLAIEEAKKIIIAQPVYLDTETTGLERTDEIIEISIIDEDGQALFESLGRVPASTRVKSAFNNFPFTVIEPATVLDEADKWQKLWNDFFLKRP